MIAITVSMNNRGDHWLCAIYPQQFCYTFDGIGETKQEAYKNAVKLFEQNGFSIKECIVVG